MTPSGSRTHGSPSDGDPTGRDSENREETVTSATRALADATAALTRLLGHQVGAISDDVGHAVAEGLREASRGLAQASESVGRAGSGGPTTRKGRADQTRTDLLDAMARAVAARGFEGASVGDVASDAGYTKGALYASFGSKSELFVTLVQREAAAGRLLPVPALTGDEPRVPAADGDAAVATALLATETLVHTARYPQDRDDLRPELESELARLAGQVNRARAIRNDQALDEAGASTSADADTALALVGVTLVAQMLAEATDGTIGDEATVARLVERLLTS